MTRLTKTRVAGTLRKVSQIVQPVPFSEDVFLHARGDNASATTRDLVQMTRVVIAHVTRNRELRRARDVKARQLPQTGGALRLAEDGQSRVQSGGGKPELFEKYRDLVASKTNA